MIYPTIFRYWMRTNYRSARWRCSLLSAQLSASGRSSSNVQLTAVPILWEVSSIYRSIHGSTLAKSAKRLVLSRGISGSPIIIHDPYRIAEDVAQADFPHPNAKHLESLPGWEAHPRFGAAKWAAVIFLNESVHTDLLWLVLVF